MAKLHPMAVYSLLRELRLAATRQGPLAVAGPDALTEPLRRELARGGVAAAVQAGFVDGASALVHVLTAPVADADRQTLAAAHRARVPIVAVLAAPELERRVPFVLATDVVRVPAGAGPSVDEISRVLAHRLGEEGTALGARLPVLREAVCRELVESFSRKAGLIGAAVFLPGADFPAITLTQLRLVLRISVAHGVEVDVERLPEVLAVIGSGLAFRAAARQAVAVVPVAGWAIKGAVAYAGTRALGEAAVRYFAERTPPGQTATT